MAEATVGRTCNKCKVHQPYCEFYKDKSRSSGYDVICKGCTRKKNKKWREENPDRVKSNMAEWFAQNHERNRQNCADYYAANKETLTSKKREDRRSDPSRVRAVDRDRYIRDREKRIASMTAWAKRNPDKRKATEYKRRARKIGAEGFYTEVDIRRIRSAQNHRCAACKRKCALTVDHIVPLSKGGSNWPRNIQLLCLSCNAGKHDRPNEEFFRRTQGTLL